MKKFKGLFIALGILGLSLGLAGGYLWYVSSFNQNSVSDSYPSEVTVTPESTVSQKESQGVKGESTSNLSVDLGKARGFLSAGSQVSDSSKIEFQRKTLESLFDSYRHHQSSPKLKEDSKGISLRYALEEQGYQIKDSSFEVWSTADTKVSQLLFTLTGGKYDDIWMVLLYDEVKEVYTIIYMNGGRPDTFG